MHAIRKTIKDLLLNHNNYNIRMSFDYKITLIGNLQIEILDSRWIRSSVTLESVLKFDPYDWMFKDLYKDNGNYFKPVKYGLSANPTLESYEPLWTLNTPSEQQFAILRAEMEKNRNNAPETYKNGIEINQKSPSLLWWAVDSLAKNCRTEFIKQQNSIIEHNIKNNIKYNDEELFKSGAKITPEILDGLEKLYKEISR